MYMTVKQASEKWGISEANEEYFRRAHAVCPITAVENRYSMMARQR